MAFANLADVETRLGRRITDPLEVAQVNQWIADVEATITARISDIEARAAEDPVYRKIVTKVVAQVVIRKVQNPEGKQNERIDDYSYGREAEYAKADLSPTDEEWAELEPDTAAASGAFTIRMPLTPGYAGNVR